LAASASRSQPQTTTTRSALQIISAIRARSRAARVFHRRARHASLRPPSIAAGRAPAPSRRRKGRPARARRRHRANWRSRALTLVSGHINVHNTRSIPEM
jgi:hypothetical protein